MLMRAGERLWHNAVDIPSDEITAREAKHPQRWKVEAHTAVVETVCRSMSKHNVTVFVHTKRVRGSNNAQI